MVADDQTHTLPSDREGLERFARFAGFKDRDAFAQTLVEHLRKVQRHYVRLFEDTPARADRLALSFPEGRRRPRDAQPARRDGLSEAAGGVGHGAALADRRLSVAARRIRPHASSPSWCRCCSTGWRGRRIRMPRSTPSIVSSAVCSAARGCSRCCKQNPDLVTLVALTLGTAPRLADILARYPEAMDALLEPTFFGALPDEAKLEAELARSHRRGAAATRIFSTGSGMFSQEQMFLIGARILSGTVSAEQAGGAFARLADVVDPRAASPGRGRLSPKATAASAASRPRCSRSASSAAAR